VKAVYEDVVAQCVPPSQILKKFLEMSDAFEVLKAEMRNLRESSEFTNIVLSPLWEEKRSRYESSDYVFLLFFKGTILNRTTFWAPTLGN